MAVGDGGDGGEGGERDIFFSNFILIACSLDLSSNQAIDNNNELGCG